MNGNLEGCSNKEGKSCSKLMLSCPVVAVPIFRVVTVLETVLKAMCSSVHRLLFLSSPDLFEYEQHIV